MAQIESQDPEQAFLEALARSRALLERPPEPARIWPTLAAAGAFALSAMLFATTAILAPPAALSATAQPAAAQDVRGPL